MDPVTAARLSASDSPTESSTAPVRSLATARLISGKHVRSDKSAIASLVPRRLVTLGGELE
ncbi:MAG: hypothetical protein ACJ78V_02045, partial [Myxococcales bacterium]